MGTPAPTPYPTPKPTPHPTPFPTPHPCDDGNHGCDKELGICLKVVNGEEIEGPGGPKGPRGPGMHKRRLVEAAELWGCGCQKGTFCSEGCAAPHKAHTCTGVTGSPTAYPTPHPTNFPTSTPTAYPTTQVHCATSGWNGWSGCTVNCGGGWRWRYRTITRNAYNNGNACPGLSDKHNCNTGCCAVHCAVNGWNGWSGCTVNCGGGTKSRYRTITRNLSCKGNACPSLSDSAKCNTDCCVVHCAVSGWNGWSGCSVACGGGWRWRYRSITRNLACSGNACPTLSNYNRCGTGCCAVHCAVAGWNGWSGCSVNCGGGTQTRYRSITRNLSCSGNACPNLAEGAKCNTHCCVSHCLVSGWNGWSGCSVKCGGGWRWRYRSITRNLSCSGNACPGLSESNSCGTGSCPTPKPTPKPTLPRAKPTPKPTPRPARNLVRPDENDGNLPGWGLGVGNPYGMGGPKNFHMKRRRLRTNSDSGE